MSPKLKAALILTGVFVLGGVAGAGASRAYTFYSLRRVMSGPAEGRARMQLELMKHELDLDSEQAAKIEAILKDAQPEREHAIEPCKAHLDEVHQHTDAAISEVLRPDQRAKFDEARAKHGHGRSEVQSSTPQ